MIVFEYFYENMDNFADLIDAKRQVEERKVTAKETIARKEKEEEELREERMDEEEGDSVQVGMVIICVAARSGIDIHIFH